ncbi:hypothetical protein, partial [Streptomyces purpurogeneiscleroticus]|uniref:hypothetical protein n=1 Tax=Streptomyces purpurogeneiscleroticus TaxID=68259 RepID=UPI001CBC5962
RGGTGTSRRRSRRHPDGRAPAAEDEPLRAAGRTPLCTDMYGLVAHPAAWWQTSTRRDTCTGPRRGRIP